MSLIPSPHTLFVRKLVEGARDEFNNVTTSLSDPIPWPVRSVDPVTQREAQQPNRDMTTIAYVVQADKTPLVPTYRDTVVYNGEDLAVDGMPDDWTVGPWANPAAGVTVYLKRVEG